MPTDKDAHWYNMKHENRGKCVIFNHEDYDEDFEFDKREGSAKDVEIIQISFGNLGFTVETHNNLTYYDIKHVLKNLQEEDHSKNDCICIFVLSHGLEKNLLCAYDVAYPLDKIWKPFTGDKCESLAGKPKLFFFQACRGDNFDLGFTFSGSSDSSETDSSAASYKIPNHADFLFAYSTVQGFRSWRNPEDGSWYIQSLCKIINNYGDKVALAKMMTMTLRKVATEYSSLPSDNATEKHQKQMPVFTTTLLKNLRLTKKNISSSLEEMLINNDSHWYNMNHKNRGKCIIFNHDIFNTGPEQRQGSAKDVERIQISFDNLGFIVKVHNNLTYDEIKDELMKLRREDHSENDCLCIFVLTHGLSKNLLKAKDKTYPLDVIWKPFTADKCKSLAEKPKLFFFQTNRGEKLDPGITIERNNYKIIETDTGTTDSGSDKIPTHADFLFAYSTFPEFSSWRNIEEGSWYIQSLCEILDDHAHEMGLARMLTMTSRKVATEYSSYASNYGHDMKQIPTITTTLLRNVFFTKKQKPKSNKRRC
ncbi:uncharacterized protein LOC127281088 [Leptopilina boulardi]|uniref:uncharacterized protein LOC127281088 n=1 Tax=Leptopilina boulardi TaxID=63433 RepID=UPI0021F608A3|nr:uncharacterized protein LOC127281088 [Leptopilina boulardi]